MHYQSDGLILYWFFGIDGSFLIQDPISAISAFDSIIRLQFRFLAAFYITILLLLFPQTQTTCTVLISCTSIQQIIIQLAYKYNHWDYYIMLQEALWIFKEHELKVIEASRIERYRAMEAEGFNEHSVSKRHLGRLINFMRTRKKQVDYPFKFEKTIYYAVALYKRYYLVNPYIQEEPVKNLICAVYLSLKINQYDEGFIAKMASKWKEKPVFSPIKRFPHFGDEGYTQSELTFLAGMRFQTALSKLIQPIQAIYEQINEVYRSKSSEELQKNTDHYELLPQIMQQLNRVYLHPTAIFLNDGSKLALTVIVMSLRKKHLPLTVLGIHLRLMAQNNLQQIQRLIFQLQLQPFDLKEAAEQSKLPKFKKPDPKKSQSPRFQPRHDTFPQQ